MLFVLFVFKLLKNEVLFFVNVKNVIGVGMFMFILIILVLILLWNVCVCLLFDV